MASVAEVILKYRDQFSDQAKRDLLAFERQHKSTMKEAKDSADILKDTLGIELPRELTKLIAQSELVGPALAAAFNVVAIVGFINALGQIPELFDKMKGAITGWDETAKKAFENEQKYIRDTTEKLNDYKQALADIAGAGQEERRSQMEDQQRIVTQLQEQIKAKKEAVRTVVTVGGEITRVPLDQREEIAALEEKLKPELDKLNKLQRDYNLQAQKNAKETSTIQVKLREDILKKSEETAEAIRKNEEEQRHLQFEHDAQMYEEERQAMEKRVQDYSKAQKAAMDAHLEMLIRNQKVIDDLAQDNIARAKNQAKEILQQAEEAKRTQEKLAEEAKRTQEKLVKDIRDIGGNLWDDMFHKGKSVLGGLADFAVEQFERIGRTIFQNLFQRLILGGPGGGGGLLGMIAPGLGKVLGLGLPGGVAAASTFGAGSLVQTGAEGTIMSLGVHGGATGLAGALGLHGGAGLLGLGSATIPVIGGAIAGAVLLGMTLFRHRTQEAPFLTDPNAAERNRTIFFFTSLVESMQQFSRSVDTFSKSVKPVTAGYILAKGTKDLMNSGQTDTFRSLGGYVNEETL